MIFRQINCGGDRNFAYIIGDEEAGVCALVDPAYNTEEILDETEQLGLTVRYVINTHDHYDHNGGNPIVSEKTGAEICLHEAAGTGDVHLKDGDVIEVGNLKLNIIHTPGHTPDSICILAEDKLLTGDTLFVGKVGGTGLGEDARDEYNSLHEKLMKLDDSVEVYPGHDVGVQPHSTIGYERANNPFIQRDSFEEFTDLKKNWAQYKIDHGIA